MEKEILVTCPYDKSHRIRGYRLMTHLTKCKKQNDKGNKVLCPLNSTHILNSNELKDHLETCSNLHSLLKGYVKDKTDMPSNINTETSISEENWDEAPEIPSYNPMASAANKNVIRCVSGLTKSEKVKFREAERARIANLNGISNIPKHSSSWENMLDEKPMRPPRTVQQFLQDMETPQNDINNSKPTLDATVKTKPSTTHEFRHKILEKLYEGCVNELNSSRKCDVNQEPNTSASDGHECMKSESYQKRKINNVLIKKIVELDLADRDSVTHT